MESQKKLIFVYLALVTTVLQIVLSGCHGMVRNTSYEGLNCESQNEINIDSKVHKLVMAMNCVVT